MSQIGSPKFSVQNVTRNSPCDQYLWKEADVGWGRSWLQCRPQSSFSLLGVLELEWPFRITPNWAEKAWPSYSHINQWRHVGREVTLVKGVLHSWGLPDFLHGRGSGQHTTVHNIPLHLVRMSSFSGGFPAFLDSECWHYQVPSDSFNSSSWGRLGEICKEGI